MAKVTVLFGILLILLGGAFWMATGQKFPTSLIPSGFGVALVALGSLAGNPDPKRRMLFMHIAVTLFKGKLFPYPAAIEEKAAMSALMLIYVVLCVRSFIAARRSRI
jgi:hypothetical protein